MIQQQKHNRIQEPALFRIFLELLKREQSEPGSHCIHKAC